VTFRCKLNFYDEQLLAPPPTPKLEDHFIGCPLLLFQLIRAYPPYLEAVWSVRNLRTHHTMVTRGPLIIGHGYRRV
jgi:hypothetical protein